MKTLKFAWLGLLIALIALAVWLKGVPGVISYDYYYKELTLRVAVDNVISPDVEHAGQIPESIKKLLEKSLSRFGHSELELADIKNFRVHGKKYIFKTTMEDFSDCYLYLLKSKSGGGEFLTGSKADASSLQRGWDVTSAVQKGSLSEGKKHDKADASDIAETKQEIGESSQEKLQAPDAPMPLDLDFEIEASCRF